MVGPALAGLLVTTAGFGWAFALDGLSYLAVIAALWMMDTTQLRQPPVTPKGRGQVREGIRYARSVPELWVPLVMMAIIGTFAYNLQTVLPLFATRDLGGSDVTFTILMSIISIGSLVGALVTARRTSMSIGTVSRAAGLFGLTLAILAVTPTVPWAALIGLGLGMSSIAFMTASTAIVQIRSAPSMRGRVLALQGIVFLGSTPIGGPIVGAISDSFGARYALAAGALAALGASLYGYLSIRGREPVQVTTAERRPREAEAPVVFGGGSEEPIPAR